jgi:hypothetical protein
MATRFASQNKHGFVTSAHREDSRLLVEQTGVFEEQRQHRVLPYLRCERSCGSSWATMSSIRSWTGGSSKSRRSQSFTYRRRSVAEALRAAKLTL